MRKTKPRVLWLFLFLAPLLLSDTAQDEVVFITNSGARYHRDNCSSLAYSKIAVSLNDVIKSYGPCSICNPPLLDAKNVRQNTAELYQVNKAELKNSSAANINRMLKAEVVGHIDGDTVRVRIPNPPEDLYVLETIRLLGVDTPETSHPDLPVQYFGEEASNFTRDILLGREVFLAFDWDLRDRYGRLLAYIYTAPGHCFNTLLISEGYGHAYIRYPFQFMNEFEDLEREAKRYNRGLWASQTE